MSHMCKRIFEFELQLSSYWQNIKFSRYCPKFHIFINIVIFQVYLQLFIDTARFRDPKKIGEFFIWWKNKNPYMLVPKQILSVLKVTRFHLQMNPPFFFQWKNHRNTNIFFYMMISTFIFQTLHFFYFGKKILKIT